MSALPLDSYPVSKLYLFPQYLSREAYEKATGVPCPEFDSDRPPKHWFDPAAEKATQRNVVYQTVIAYNEGGAVILDEEGRPMTESLLLVKKEAATVNIAPDICNYPGADVPPVPVPMRALEPDEELAMDFGGLIMVRNKKLWIDKNTGFTADDRALLTAIARKLGVALS